MLLLAVETRDFAQPLLVLMLPVCLIVMPDAAHMHTPGALGLVNDMISRCLLQSHTCAVLVGGAVRCWGSNSAGQVMLLVFVLRCRDALAVCLI